MDQKASDNGVLLREVVGASGLTQRAALDRYNVGQGKAMALRTFKSYLAMPGSKTRVRCPDGVLMRMREVLKECATRISETKSRFVKPELPRN